MFVYFGVGDFKSFYIKTQAVCFWVVPAKIQIGKLQRLWATKPKAKEDRHSHKCCWPQGSDVYVGTQKFKPRFQRTILGVLCMNIDKTQRDGRV